jgi:hypothetical protein
MFIKPRVTTDFPLLDSEDATYIALDIDPSFVIDAKVGEFYLKRHEENQVQFNQNDEQMYMAFLNPSRKIRLSYIKLRIPLICFFTVHAKNKDTTYTTVCVEMIRCILLYLSLPFSLKKPLRG